jgi:hypothetical protein
MGRFKRAWMAFALTLGKIQTAILLTLVYVIAVGPIAVMLRGIGRRDLLDLRGSHQASFAHTKQQIPTDPERCERQF